MDEEAFNASTRKFLRKLGVTAHREIEQVVRERIDSGELQGDEILEVQATITVGGIPREIVVPGDIRLT